MIKFFVLVLGFINLNLQAEPMPWGLMVNKQHCSKYWAGDECVYYKLPPGWKALYPDGKKLNYNGKKCSFEIGNEESCCKELGLKFRSLKLEKDLSIASPDFCKNK